MCSIPTTPSLPDFAATTRSSMHGSARSGGKATPESARAIVKTVDEEFGQAASVLGGLDHLERHRDAGGFGAWSLGDLSPMTHGREGGLDRYLEPWVGCP